MKKKPKNKNCCFKNIDKAINISRATWSCPICKADVSLLFVFYMDCKSTNKRNNLIIK